MTYLPLWARRRARTTPEKILMASKINSELYGKSQPMRYSCYLLPAHRGEDSAPADVHRIRQTVVWDEAT